jgi:hypothetical protein
MREDVASAWSKVNSKVGKKRDVRKLPEYLNGGERVLAMTGGQVGGNQGLLVATDRRALFVSEGVVRHSFEDFPYDRVTTVTVTRGLVFGTIVLSTAGVSRVVQNVARGEAEEVAAVLRERVEASTRGRHAPQPAAAPGRHHASVPAAQPAPGGIAAELRELAALRDQGVLTNAEFEQQKARLLGR